MNPQDLSYAIYTSGLTTGVTHSSQHERTDKDAMLVGIDGIMAMHVILFMMHSRLFDHESDIIPRLTVHSARKIMFACLV